MAWGDSWIAARRRLPLRPDTEARWVRLYVHEIEGVWAAIFLAENALTGCRV